MLLYDFLKGLPGSRYLKTRDAGFKEEEHPRGQPNNPGQFVEGGGSSSSGSEESESKKEESQSQEKSNEEKLKEARKAHKEAREKNDFDEMVKHRKTINELEKVLAPPPTEIGKTTWEEQAKRQVANRYIKANFNINSVSGSIEQVNATGSHLSKLCNQFPEVHFQLKKHRMSFIKYQGENEVLKSRYGHEMGRRSRGVYEDKTGDGAMPAITMKALKRRDALKFDTDAGKVGYVFGSENNGHSDGDVLNHELGHHMMFCIGKKARREWYDVCEKMGGSIALEKTVSKYAGTIIKATPMGVDRNPEDWYQEGFAESFAKFTNPNYKKGNLPQSIENYMTKYFKKDKS
jgi:hypothetical protein